MKFNDVVERLHLFLNEEDVKKGGYSSSEQMGNKRTRRSDSSTSETMLGNKCKY